MTVRISRIVQDGRITYRCVWLVTRRRTRLAAWFNRLVCRYRPRLGFEVAIVDRDFADRFMPR